MDYDFVLFGQLAVSAGLGCQVYDHTAGSHKLHHLLGDELGGGLARNQGGRDDDVDLLALLGK